MGDEFMTWSSQYQHCSLACTVLSSVSFASSCVARARRALCHNMPRRVAQKTQLHAVRWRWCGCRARSSRWWGRLLRKDCCSSAITTASTINPLAVPSASSTSAGAPPSFFTPTCNKSTSCTSSPCLGQGHELPSNYDAELCSRNSSTKTHTIENIVVLWGHT